jgi:hypothetical protein
VIIITPPWQTNRAQQESKQAGSAAAPRAVGKGARVAQSCAPIEHSCFLERSQQHEATRTPSFACCVAAHAAGCGCVRWGFPYTELY